MYEDTHQITERNIILSRNKKIEYSRNKNFINFDFSKLKTKIHPSTHESFTYFFQVI